MGSGYRKIWFQIQAQFLLLLAEKISHLPPILKKVCKISKNVPSSLYIKLLKTGPEA